MNKKIVLILALLLTVNIPVIRITNAQTTVVYVNPQLTTKDQTGETFQINASISQVTDLAAWEFKMYYESSVLNATNLAQGPFLKTAGNTSLIPLDFTDSYNATHGRIWFACTLQGLGPGASGNGTLATITFKVKGLGIAHLHLADTDLLDSTLPPSGPNHIPHATIDGIFQTTGHDIALIKVTPLSNAVGQGFLCRINVTAENQGYFTETFNVTLYANARTAATINNIVLATTIRADITFTWNTTYFDRGNYTISACASVVSGETDVGDNNCTGGSVQITKVGDLGSRVGSTNVFFAFDGAVTSADLQLFRLCFKGTAPQNAMYLGDLGSRVNGLNTFFACDGQVTSADLQLFRLCFKGLYSPTIYIRADGNIDPQTAPIQRDGDLYFFTDNILSNIDGVVIERNDMTLDGAGYTIQGTGAYASKGLDLSGRINVTIKNLKIEGFYNGIWLHSSFGISTLGNNITENVNCGVWLSASSNSTVTGNNIKKNNGYGIVLDDSSSHITVTGNNMIENDAFGIFLEDSSYNTVSGNNIKKNLGGMLLFGFSNTIHENNITGNNEYGIVINGSSNTLSNNNITENNYDGIEAADSSYNTISGNNIEGNNGYGIVLYDSHNNFVAGNKIENNAAGMHMSLSLSNNVTGNTITNNDEGIGLLSSSSNSISGNKISNNKIGISIGIAWLHDSSSNNRIYGNNITANNEIGIILDRCPSNRFYHNNFINNAVQVENIGATNNMWDDGYPSGGNYWSDYVGPDLYKGPNQNEPGSDGIGDTPYFVDTNNPDNYPFMHPIVS